MKILCQLCALLSTSLLINEIFLRIPSIRQVRISISTVSTTFMLNQCRCIKAEGKESVWAVSNVTKVHCLYMSGVLCSAYRSTCDTPQKNRLNKHKKWKQKSCLFTSLSVVESMPSELVNPTFHCYLFVHQDHWTFVMVMNKSDICYYKSLFMKHPAAPQEIINVYRSNSFLKNEAINICGRLVFLDRIWIAL